MAPSFTDQVRSQLYVAFLNKVRRWGSLLVELLIPVLMMFALSGIKTTTDVEEFPYRTFSEDARLLPSTKDLLDFPSLDNIGAGGLSGEWYIANLNDFISHGASNIAYVCDIQAATSQEPGQDVISLNDICAMQKFVVIPDDSTNQDQVEAAAAFKSWWINTTSLLSTQNRFDLGGQSVRDNAELDTYIAALDYGQPTRQRIGLAIVFESGAPNYQYQIRVNRTASYAGGPPKNNIPRTGATRANTSDFSRGTTDYSKQYIFSGFSTVQQDVDNWILQNATGVDTTALRSSSYGMPTQAYKSDEFWTSLGTTFALFLIVALLYPVARVIQQLTADKETRVRELMEVMGLRTGAYFFAWIVFYVGFFALLAGVITGISFINVFVYSSPGVIYVYFLLYLTASIAYSFFIASMFYRANLATVVGLLVYFLGYLIYSPLATEESPLGPQLLVSLIPSACFSFGTISLAQFEGGLVGLNWSNVGEGSNPYTMATCLAMLLFDTVLYFLLALYLDAVLKSPLGAARKKWHFPCTFCCRRKRKATTKHSGEYAAFIKQLEIDEAAAVAASDGTVQPVDAQLAAQREAGNAIAIGSLSKTYKSAKGPVKAVNELSLSFFQGQITALLGHNGAGKSTVSNILAGLVSSSSGNAFVGGLSIDGDMAEIRNNLGVCPQVNILYPNLTVAEHIRVFSGIKGMKPGPETEEAINKIIADVGLSPKINTVSKALSGGQKRKLQLAIALFGDSQYIICDEPTSGLDPYARQFVQQTLARFREGRTIILSTHYMDEADLLGDRIAIMSKGKLQAVGTSLFLKKRFGVGYQISCDCLTPPNMREPIIECITKHVPEAKVTSNVGAELMLELPLTASTAFADLLEELDSQKETLGILDTGISVSTLESCFLRVADGDVDGKAATFATQARAIKKQKSSNLLTAQDTDAIKLEPATTKEDELPAPECAGSDNNNVPSSWRHTKALLLKRFRYAKRDKGAFCCQIMIPVVFLLLGFIFTAISTSSTSPPMWFDAETNQWNIDPALANPVPFNWGQGASAPKNQTVQIMDGFVLPRVDRSQSFDVGPTATYCTALSFFESQINSTLRLLPRFFPVLPDDLTGLNATVIAPLLGVDLCPESSAFPNSTANFDTELNGSRFNSSGSRYGSVLYDVLPAPESLEYTVVFNFTGVHALPLMMNRINSALLASLRGVEPSAWSISAANYPLPRTQAESDISAGFISFSAALALGIAFSFVPAGYAVFIVREKQNKSFEQQTINGVSPAAYWSSSFLFDLATYAVPFLLAVILIFAFETSREGFANDGKIGPVLVLFIFFGLAVTFFTYCWTFAFSSYRSAQLGMIGINLLGGLVLLMTSFIMGLLENTYEANDVLVYFYRIIPTFCFSHGLLQVAQKDLLNSVYNSNARGGDPSNPVEYGVWSWEIAGADVCFLGIEIFLYGLLLVGLQRRFPGGYCTCSKHRLCCGGRGSKAVIETPQGEDQNQDQDQDQDQVGFMAAEDSDVIDERNRILNSPGSWTEGVDAENPAPSDTLVLRGVRKVYPPIGAKAKPKTAVADLSLGIHKNECFGLLGVNGAGKSTSMSMAAGSLVPTSGDVTVNSFHMATQRGSALKSLGFCPQYDAIFDLLTGREHLELYGAIKGIPPAILKPQVDACLHELSLDDFADRLAGGYSGGNKRKLSLACAIIGKPSLLLVDEVAAGVDPASRRFLWQVLSKLAKTSSIVLTTHSMEECEALCSRIGIMVDGRLKCLGTAQHLKSRYGTGYQLEVSLQIPSDEQIADACKAMGLDSESKPLNKEDVVLALGKAGSAAFYQECFYMEGSGVLLYQQLELGTGTIEPRSLADWYVTEKSFRDFSQFLLETSNLQGVQLIERQSLRLRYSIPFQSQLKLHDIFRIFEAERDRVDAYSLGQTTLETIFNNFSATQSQELN